MIAGQPAPGPADELQLAGEVLVKYWILAVPTAVASLCVSIAVVFGVLSVIATTIFGHFAGGHVGTAVGLGTGLIVGFSFFFAALVALFVAQAVVIRAGDAAFAGLQPNLSSAFGGVITRLPDLVVAGVAVTILAIIPLVLSIVIVGIPLLFLLWYFTMYVGPAVIVGGENGINAIGTSFRLTTRRVGESVIAWLGILIVSIAGVVVNGILAHIPPLGFLSAFVVGGFTAAYAALVTVRFYRLLHDGPASPGGTTSASSYGSPQPPEAPPPEPPPVPLGAAVLAAVLATGAFARADAVALDFSPIHVNRTGGPAEAAPADVSFGPYPMSVLGIENAIGRADDDLAHHARRVVFTNGPIAYAVSAIRDWEHRYPHDPWIPQSLLALERVYLHAGTAEGRNYAGRVAAWLIDDYPGTAYAVRGRDVIANARAN